MQRRQVMLVDAFAAEITGGRPIAVDPTGELSTGQQRAVASELGTSGCVSASEKGGKLEYVDCDGSQAVVSAAVAAAAGLHNRGALDSGSYELSVSPDVTPADPFLVDLSESGPVSVQLPALAPEDPGVDLETIGNALGIDVAAMADVGADLPPAVVEGFGGTLLVPVNFLQHVSGASPAAAELPELLASAGARRAVVFTFDTLEAHTDVHARVFDPTASGNERPASGVGAGACVCHLFAESMFDGDREEVTFECGQFVDRPATIQATVSDAPQVGGTALTSLDAAVGVPDDDEDEIIEV